MTTLTEVFPCFFLSCKANARVKPAKTGHGPHSSLLLCCSVYFLCCSMYCLFCVVLCIVCVYMCTELLPPSGYPIAVKYIISNYFYIKTTKVHNISNLFWNNILHVSDGLFVHHQESKTVHTASGIRHTGPVAVCWQEQDGTAVPSRSR